MINKLKLWVRKNEFNPGPIGLLTNPFFIARRGLANAIKEFGTEIKGRTVDIGCGTKPYKKFFRHSEYVGLEYDTGIDQEKKIADIYYTGERFPFNDTSFDSAVCNQVLEHIFNPETFISEINRILKTGGKLLLSVPFVWDEHEQPYDFARYSSFGVEHMFVKKGFIILKKKKSVSDFRVIVQLFTGYIYKISRRIPVIKQLVQLLFIFPINTTGTFISFFLPENNDLYLDNIYLIQKVSDK